MAKSGEWLPADGRATMSRLLTREDTASEWSPSTGFDHSTRPTCEEGAKIALAPVRWRGTDVTAGSSRGRRRHEPWRRGQGAAARFPRRGRSSEVNVAPCSQTADRTTKKDGTLSRPFLGRRRRPYPPRESWRRSDRASFWIPRRSSPGSTMRPYELSRACRARERGRSTRRPRSVTANSCERCGADAGS